MALKYSSKLLHYTIKPILHINQYKFCTLAVHKLQEKFKARTIVIKDTKEEKTESYIDILNRIRDGIKNPPKKEIQKYDPKNKSIDIELVNTYITKISNLNIKKIRYNLHENDTIENRKTLSEKHTKLSQLYNEILSYDNKTFHLDLYSQLLLSFGNLNRVNLMLLIYRKIKHKKYIHLHR